MFNAEFHFVIKLLITLKISSCIKKSTIFLRIVDLFLMVNKFNPGLNEA